MGEWVRESEWKYITIKVYHPFCYAPFLFSESLTKYDKNTIKSKENKKIWGRVWVRGALSVGGVGVKNSKFSLPPKTNWSGKQKNKKTSDTSITQKHTLM